jgi:hypothetical protein
MSVRRARRKIIHDVVRNRVSPISPKPRGDFGTTWRSDGLRPIDTYPASAATDSGPPIRRASPGLDKQSPMSPARVQATSGTAIPNGRQTFPDDVSMRDCGRAAFPPISPSNQAGSTVISRPSQSSRRFKLFQRYGGRAFAGRLLLWIQVPRSHKPLVVAPTIVPRKSRNTPGPDARDGSSRPRCDRRFLKLTTPTAPPPAGRIFRHWLRRTLGDAKPPPTLGRRDAYPAESQASSRWI